MQDDAEDETSVASSKSTWSGFNRCVPCCRLRAERVECTAVNMSMEGEEGQEDGDEAVIAAPRRPTSRLTVLDRLRHEHHVGHLQRQLVRLPGHVGADHLHLLLRRCGEQRKESACWGARQDGGSQVHRLLQDD